jgi:hypothetical protein
MHKIVQLIVVSLIASALFAICWVYNIAFIDLFPKIGGM